MRAETRQSTAQLNLSWQLKLSASLCISVSNLESAALILEWQILVDKFVNMESVNNDCMWLTDKIFIKYKQI